MTGRGQTIPKIFFIEEEMRAYTTQRHYTKLYMTMSKHNKRLYTIPLSIIYGFYKIQGLI